MERTNFEGLGNRLRQAMQRHQCVGLGTESEHYRKIHISNELALHHSVLMELLRNWLSNNSKMVHKH